MDEMSNKHLSATAGDTIADNLERLLIRVIRRHPALYNRTHMHYNRTLYPDAHQTAWRQVSKELRLEENSCKSLYVFKLVLL